jgi:ribosomal protein S18 acetylase RimI-like enzyme
MIVSPVDPSDRSELRRFVALERELWGHHPLYWSEFDADLIKRFRGESAFNREMDHKLFVLTDGSGDRLGRAVGYVNRRWQRQRGVAAGFIGNFCFGPGSRPDQVSELFGVVEDWLKQEGCTRVIAGIDGTGALGVGVLTADHDASPRYPLKWHPHEYADLIEAVGYQPVRRFWVYLIRFDSDGYRTAVSRSIRNAACDIRPVERRRWKSEIALVRNLFNATFEDEWEMNEYTEEEFIETWGQMRWILDPQAFLIAEVDKEPAGFCLGLPDITPLMRSFRGRLGPISMIRMLRGVSKAQRHGLFVVGVRERFRGRHIAQSLACNLYRHYERQGSKSAAYYYVDDKNLASRHVAESLGAEGDIKLTCYQKSL